MNYLNSLRIVWSYQFGETSSLKNLIGEENFTKLIEKKIIVQGERYPEVWKITEKGKNFCDSLFTRSKIKKLIDKFLYLFI